MRTRSVLGVVVSKTALPFRGILSAIIPFILDLLLVATAVVCTSSPKPKSGGDAVEQALNPKPESPKIPQARKTPEPNTPKAG